MIVAIDSTTDRLSVAVGGTGGRVVTHHVEGARRHAAELPGRVDAALASLGARWLDVLTVLVADGPGGFTGLRVAVAWAKGVVRGRAPRLGVASTLLVRASNGSTLGETVVGVGNAMRGELFAARYRFEPNGAIVELAEPRVIAAVIDLAQPGDRVAHGPPEAADLIGLLDRPGGLRWIDQVATWEPNYGRLAEAQVKWERSHGVGLDDSGRHPG